MLGRGHSRAPNREHTREISAWSRITAGEKKTSTELGRSESAGELIFFSPTENSLFPFLSSDT